MAFALTSGVRWSFKTNSKIWREICFLLYQSVWVLINVWADKWRKMIVQDEYQDLGEMCLSSFFFYERLIKVDFLLVMVEVKFHSALSRRYFLLDVQYPPATSAGTHGFERAVHPFENSGCSSLSTIPPVSPHVSAADTCGSGTARCISRWYMHHVEVAIPHVSAADTCRSVHPPDVSAEILPKLHR